jgi:UDP-hydrolysing UDP-N-acetyl-D-glucosamine 2-epimerase
MKILAISGTRADWGLLQPVLLMLRDNPKFTLEILVTGQHMMPGTTSVPEIQAAGFEIEHFLNMGLIGNETGASLCNATAKAVAGVGQVLESSKPELVLVLGDRYEILAAVSAALISKVPVAHIAGGDVTEGAFDDSIRHAITKMAALHFTTSEEAARRVRQMGEDPRHVFATGNPGIDQVLATSLMSRSQFFDSIGLIAQKKNFIVTLHPATLSKHNSKMCRAMIGAFDKIADVGLIFTGSNADPGAAELDKIIQDWVLQRPNATFHSSLGSQRYFSALQHCDLVIGNSSSGLYEAPSFEIPTVNIGDRQARRIRAASVIDCKPETGAILIAIEKALSGDWSGTVNPYGDGAAAPKIVSKLENFINPEQLIRKSFKDIHHD